MSEKNKTAGGTGQFFSALLIGLINGVLCIPVTISFCSIIFRDEVFEEHMPKLVKLVLFSSAIHQLCFSTFSSLPFAVGQVQDAGLIFLSAIATSVVEQATEKRFVMATTLFVLAVCTFLLGLMLLAVAKLKLASVIQYLPMPVIGGYLAYIGFFCGKAGLAMMGGIVNPTFSDASFHSVVLMAPGLVIGLTMYMLLRNVRSPFLLPICMGVMLAVFYLIMWVSGASFEDARSFGWIAQDSPLEPFYHSWMLYDINLVEWHILPSQWLRLICMFLVVAFSSSLDVAAIEMEVGLPLNYNTELFTVGLSNCVSGLTGGYTGSYIFSQTIFNLRRKVSTRWCGYTVAVLELIVVALPFSVTSYVPKLFFGSLLILISVDLMFEWLVACRVKMTHFEYAVCLASFFAIIFTNIEIGMMMGILLATFSFVVTYARLQTVSVAELLSSTVVRTFEDRAILIANRGKIVTISLKGYIFFGSAVTILEEVKRHVIVQSVPQSQASEVVNEPIYADPRSQEMKPLLGEGMKNISGYQSNAEKVHKVSAQDIESFNTGQMIPRYSFSLNVSPPKYKQHPMMMIKRSHSLFTDRPHPSGSELGHVAGSYQAASSLQVPTSAPPPTSNIPIGPPTVPGIIGPLLFQKQASGSLTDHFSDGSANNSAHGPGGVPRKKRTVSFDKSKTTPDVEMGLLAAALISSQAQANSVGIADAPPAFTATPLSPIREPREPETSNEPAPAKKKSLSLFATIWQNQQKKREKLMDSVSVPRKDKEFNSLTPKGNFSPNARKYSPRFSPPDPTTKPAASALKPVSAFPDVNYDAREDSISTEYLILDFSRVLGVDATAARSCFMMLVQLMRSSQVIVVFAHMSKEIEVMLRNQRVILETDIVIPHLDDALEWCEDRVLVTFKDKNKKKEDVHEVQKHASTYSKAFADRQDQGTIKPSTSYGDFKELLGNSRSNSLIGSDDGKGNGGGKLKNNSPTPPSSSSSSSVFGLSQPTSAGTLRKILVDYLETDVGVNPQIDSLLNSENLLKYFKLINFNERELIFDIDDYSDSVYFIEKGNVEIVSLSATATTSSTVVKTKGRTVTIATPQVQRVNKVSAGGAFGEADFFLGRRHSVRAYTMTPCKCWILDRESYANMELQNPNLCLLIQHTMLKSLAISSTCSLYSLSNNNAEDDDEPDGGGDRR